MNPVDESLVNTEEADSAAQLLPISCAKDLFRNERFTVQTISNTTVLTHSSHMNVELNDLQAPHETNADKKPSYLNLACSVSGYSNLTTYDSKIRQDINKSREVSPIRPSTSSMPYCKKSNALTPPVVLTMSNVHVEAPHLQTHAYNSNNNNGTNNANADIGTTADNNNDVHNTSFVRQRIERLYGPGALAQGFYSPRKRNDAVPAVVTKDNISSELALKFKQLSPRTQNYVQHKEATPPPPAATTMAAEQYDSTNGDAVDLPVLRHLSKQFRAQLPAVTPKKTFHYGGSPEKQEAVSTAVNSQKLAIDEPDHQVQAKSLELQQPQAAVVASASSKGNAVEKAAVRDAHFFLNLLHNEQQRLLKMAELAEGYLEQLKGMTDVSEDTLGMLRSAAGKARLLVNQKMKQFEGLCHNNLNSSPNEQFPTTIDDLQGFWDMVYLQVDHLDAIFVDVEKLKNNNWQKSNDDIDNGDSASVATIKSSTTPTNSKVDVNKSVRSSRSNASSTNGNNKTVSKSPSATSNSSAAAKREAQRKQLMELKRANKSKLEESKNEATAKDEETIEIFVRDALQKS